MKPIIQKLWMFIAVLWTSISASAYDFEVDGVQYKILSIGDRTCSVEKITAEAGEKVSIQEKVSYNNALFTITQFESGCASSILKELDIEECVITELSGSFSRATNLESVKLPQSLTIIGDYTFSYCGSLRSISIPDNVASIGSYAFRHCTQLNECNLPFLLKIIGNWAFEDCEALKSISIPPYVESIGNHCFESCKALSDLILEGRSDSPEIEIPQLGKSSFWNIGAFTDCNPTSIEINRTIIYRRYTAGSPDCAFEKAPKTLKIGNVPSNIPYGLFRNGTPSNLIISDRSNILELPQSYDVINLYLGGLVNKHITATNVQIGDLVTYLPSYFFTDCRFSNIDLPSSIESIGEGCFKNCLNLEAIEIPTSVRVIPKVSFSNCTSLKKIILNEDLETIQEKAFEEVDLEILECRSTTPASIGIDAFTNKTYLNASLIVKKDAIETYKNAENWRNFFNIKCFTPVTGLSLEPQDVLLEVGQSLPLNVKYLIDDPEGYPLVDFELIWSSENPEIASVTDGGLLEASGVGETLVSVHPSNNTSVNGQCSIKIIPVIPEYFEVSDIRYHKLSNNQVEVAPKIYTGDLIIPSSVDYNDKNFSVVGIDVNALNGCYEINSIQIPGTIQLLPTDVFSGVTNLHKLVIESAESPLTMGYNSKLNLSSKITPFPNPSDVDERRTGFRNGYYDGLCYGLPIERLVINRDIELPKYYERTYGNSTSSYSTVYNDIIYYPPFYGLSNLKYVEIGENVSAICKNQIEAVVNAIPTTMAYTNFGKCDNIEVVVSNNPNAPIGGGFSQNVYENTTLFLPNGGEDSYRNDDYWKHFSRIENAPFIATESLIFEDDEIILDINENKTLMPIINPEDASIKTLKWSSSAPSIIAVSEDGSISSNTREGDVIITASTCDGTGISTSIKVVVQKGAGVPDVLADAPYKVSVENGHIHISGKSDSDIVEIFNLQGQLITSSTNNILRINEKGVYLVRIDSKCIKVVL